MLKLSRQRVQHRVPSQDSPRASACGPSTQCSAIAGRGLVSSEVQPSLEELLVAFQKHIITVILHLLTWK